MNPRITLLICLSLACSVVLHAQEKTPLETLNIRSIGPAAMSGRITSIACDPEDSRILYVGAASGGVWRSRNAGTNWEPIFDEAPTQSVGALAINPLNPDEIWVGTGEGNPRNSQNFGMGVFKSIDGGENWMHMGLKNTHTIHRIIVHPHSPEIVWVASLGSSNGPNPERGVFKTTDGGKTWDKVLYVNDLTGCADLVIDPSNPNKLIAAMWEYRRWPWFFKSGGEGSGLYVSYDGGETWTERTEEDGLPKGELGRMGLAIAASNTDIVYAYVEARENAFFKSYDGGKKWKKMATKNMGNRPFYYADIFADPQNENIIYSIHSTISRSIDGGRTFDPWINYYDIHPDHHAFWINPKDPRHLIDGNDGGLNITYDGGKTWRYTENIPIGQFYHIDIDNQVPYRIYGGLQDNGSWVGPSAVWKRGGMRNSEWRELYFGDGFDVVPHPGNPRYCMAMSQGGNVAVVDIETGKTRFVKPLHPDGVDLRFSWNAGIAQDPHNNDGIYFGSQFLHYSPDYGHSWRIISPDLTTNDSTKLKQSESGGLTLDVTNAENFCTILAIAPSKVDRQTIWVGTDDGRLQITRDGGQSWADVSGRMPEMPDYAWIPYIELSEKNAGEAFVVVNNYRQNDWQPYLYHTRDHGQTWKRMVSEDNVEGFCLSVVQDLVEPNLLFLGTDQGLYYSIDYGNNWTHWPRKALPSMPVQDMKIHPREGDLVLGTFGRAIWVLDNLNPLRALARSEGKLYDKPFAVFEPQSAVLASYASYDGPRFVADETFRGQNKSTGARIPVWVKPPSAADDDKPEDKEETEQEEEEKEEAEEEKEQESKGKKSKKATVVVQNLNGDTLRVFTRELDTLFNIVYWGLDTKGVRFPSKRKPKPDADEPGGGPRVDPGTYKVKVIYNGVEDSTTVEVLDDPRLDPVPPRDRAAKREAIHQLYESVERSHKAYQRLLDAEEAIKLSKGQMVNVPDSLKKEVLDQAKTLSDSIAALKETFFTHKESKGIVRGAEGLNSYHYTAYSYLGAEEGAPSPSAEIAMARAERALEAVIERINALMEEPWKAYREAVESLPLELFKDFDKL